jgi:cytochrome P450
MTAPTLHPTSPRPYDGIDVSSRKFWSQPSYKRDESLAVLRDERPVSWHEPPEWPLPHTFAGFWAVTRHADIQYVSQHNDLFHSGEGANFNPAPVEFSRQLTFFLELDPPAHTRIRRLVGVAFTPRVIATMRERIEANARQIVTEFARMDEADVVQDLSRKLPLRTLADLVGIPDADRDQVARAAEGLIGIEPDGLLATDDPLALMMEGASYLREYGKHLGARRRDDPRDDLMSRLATAEFDGERLSDDEMGAALVLLAVAGNDTTKQTTSHTVRALAQFPEQKRWLMEDLDGRLGTAVEEFIRWATPVHTFSRIATRDTELGGQRILAGEKVSMFYRSGNRDARVFANPYAFDLSRDPNPHVGFGGGGVHYCLGNHVAKAQLRALFRELLTTAPELEVGEREWLDNVLIDGIVRMPVRNPAPLKGA